MYVAVVGGGLQGLEASYLAKKAGWNVLLLDKRKRAPATGLCDQFIQGDVRTIQDLDRVFKKGAGSTFFKHTLKKNMQ